MTTKDGERMFPVAISERNGPWVDRFLSKVDAGDFDPKQCWVWTGAKSEKGYGVFGPAHRSALRAHRFAFRLHTGRNPEKMVLHSCDNPPCVNPYHLSEGTHTQNMRQMAERKRATREEAHHKSVLDVPSVTAIYLLHKGSGYTTRELAKMFGVHQSTIAAITGGKLWKDVVEQADAMLAQREKQP